MMDTFDATRRLQEASAMIARIVLGTIGLVLATISVKRMFDNLRRSPVRVANEEVAAARAVTQLKQDPRTGVYYPAD
jgi:hypothetical protein